MTARCAACPAAAGIPCLRELDQGRYPWACEWAASGDPLRRRHVAERSAIGLVAVQSPASRPQPRLLTADELERQRAAENCPHRDCVGCGCQGCRCRPEGRRPGEVVTIADCLRCVREPT